MQHEKLARLTDCWADALSNCLGVPTYYTSLSVGLLLLLRCLSGCVDAHMHIYMYMHVHLPFYLTILMAFLSITVIATNLLHSPLFVLRMQHGTNDSDSHVADECVNMQIAYSSFFSLSVRQFCALEIFKHLLINAHVVYICKCIGIMYVK